MIRLEGGVLVLDAPISKEDAQAVQEFAKHIKEQERERIISLIEKTHEHGMTHSERCAIRHDFADYLVERIKGD